MLAGLWSAMLGCYFEACWLRARLNLRGSRGPHLVSHAVLPEASLLAAANVQLSIPGHLAVSFFCDVAKKQLKTKFLVLDSNSTVCL